VRRGSTLAALGTLGSLLACEPANPCSSSEMHLRVRFSQRYVGHWVVARGDTLTFPDSPPISDRFRLADVVLDTAPAIAGNACVFRGRLVFRAPRAETLAVRWFGQPEQAIVQGWPADLGPFAGVSLAWWGKDSLRGSVLFDARLGVQVRPGVTAQFVAGRLSSQP